MGSLIPPGADLSQIPIGVNPDGSPPNFTDSAPSLVTAVIVSGSIFAALATVALVLRFLANYRITGRLFLDDGERSL